MSLVVPHQSLAFLQEKEFTDKLKRLRGLSQTRQTDKYAKFVQRRRNFTVEKHRKKLRNNQQYWRKVVDMYVPTGGVQAQLQGQRAKLVRMIEHRMKQYN